MELWKTREARGAVGPRVAKVARENATWSQNLHSSRLHMAHAIQRSAGQLSANSFGKQRSLRASLIDVLNCLAADESAPGCIETDQGADERYARACFTAEAISDISTCPVSLLHGVLSVLSHPPRCIAVCFPGT